MKGSISSVSIQRLERGLFLGRMEIVEAKTFALEKHEKALHCAVEQAGVGRSAVLNLGGSS